ncbi:MAG: YfcE family phosphodiesterase [Lachnospiraceae bacterium]
MKVLIISDTHGKHDNFKKVIEKEKPIDMMIHCGDTEGGEYLMSTLADCHCEIILGNNDYFSGLPRDRFFQLAGKSVWLTHGHDYYVGMNLAMIQDEAMSRGADVVMFGHSHKPVLLEDQIVLVNPGSLSYPRQANKKPSYLILEIDEKNDWKFEFNYL